MPDPSRLSAPAEAAGDKERALELGQRVQVEEIQPVDLAVAGSVAVNRSGARAIVTGTPRNPRVQAN
jgi:5-formyltetrahydrofolate cyclo-ligase